ncbi:MAG TPA: hypothetical protein VGV37_16985 [Aliidongia sp.]|uniref:hypothetical protein n=1 Tax=Aliidongia sp. TaxID=1914230 RepID=UPI002DDD025F|nr:hypothetical protein [Aliidongia sp.]HEV2676223.1 hypothetical protein [Aliidongia sp.]
MTKDASAGVAGAGISIPDQIAAVARTPGATGGHEFASLLAQVAGESGFKPHAVNKQTGAAGPFQFVKNTWLSLMKEHGQAMGVKPGLLAQIKTGANGRPTIADPQALKEVLDLRHDISLSAKMAAKYLDENKTHLSRILHREANEAEVQISFLLGASGAAHLIKAAGSNPDMPVDQVVPKAVAANRSLFHDHQGQTMTAGEAVAHLAARYRADKAKFAAYTNPAANPTVSKIDA